MKICKNLFVLIKKHLKPKVFFKTQSLQQIPPETETPYSQSILASYQLAQSHIERTLKTIAQRIAIATILSQHPHHFRIVTPTTQKSFKIPSLHLQRVLTMTLQFFLLRLSL